MYLIIIFGPPAVGKMTVAQKLSNLVGAKVFHNHLLIDLLTKFFDFKSTPYTHLIKIFRLNLLRELSKNNISTIFTFAWDFKYSHDTKQVFFINELFAKYGNQVYFVELEADCKTRLKRNKSKNRLKHKDQKNIQAIKESITAWETDYQLNSESGNFPFPDPSYYIRINTKIFSATQSAKIIRDKFDLDKKFPH